LELAVYREPDATGPGGYLVVGVSLQLPRRHGADGLVPKAVEELLKRLAFQSRCAAAAVSPAFSSPIQRVIKPPDSIAVVPRSSGQSSPP
jgi:hypothetical protein